jgi:hypothetical protein
MSRKFVMLTLAFLSIAPSASVLFKIGVSPAISGDDTVTQNTGRTRETAEWANTWCTSPRQAIDYRCRKSGNR